MNSVQNGHLSTEALAFCSGEVNTEYRCLVLGALDETRRQTQDEVHDRIMTACGGATKDKLSPYNIGNTFRDRVPDVLVQTFPIAGTQHYEYKKRPELARLITGWAGQHLKFAEDTALPLRSVLGESVKNPRCADGPQSIEVRLGVLACASKLASLRWCTGPELVNECEDLGYNGLTVEGHLKKLTNAGIMEKRGGGGGGRSHVKEFRLAQTNGSINPSAEIKRFLGITARLAILDEATIDEGNELMEEYLSGKKTDTVTHLLHRTWASTGKSGKRKFKTSHEVS